MEIWNRNQDPSPGPIETARMGSSGSWYGPIVRANAVLAYRACKASPLRWSDSTALMEVMFGSSLWRGGQAPTLRTAKKWADETPDYPEQAVASGLVDPISQLIPAFRSYLKDDWESARMGQVLLTRVPPVAVQTSADGIQDRLGNLLRLITLGFLGYAAVKNIRKPGLRPEEVRDSASRRSRLRPTRRYPYSTGL